MIYQLATYAKRKQTGEPIFGLSTSLLTLLNTHFHNTFEGEEAADACPEIFVAAYI